jgi:hypothetical protein
VALFFMVWRALINANVQVWRVVLRFLSGVGVCRFL